MIGSWLHPAVVLVASSALSTSHAFHVHPQLRHCTAVPVPKSHSYAAGSLMKRASPAPITNSKAFRNLGTILQEGNFNVDEPVNSQQLTTPLDKPVLAVTDLLSLLLFAGIGKASHSADGSLDLPAVLQTAAPFLFAWFGTSPLTGVYKDIDLGSDGLVDVGRLVAKGWIVAIPLGCALRGLVKGYVPPLPFVVVTMISTLVILGGSRILFAVVENKVVQSNE